ncbi:uncharacterized protein TNCV_95781 [Trichonephila clavipes]|nr:uncharacterized protein TNCV_95781 [Trichonephila clavipes]
MVHGIANKSFSVVTGDIGKEKRYKVCITFHLPPCKKSPVRRGLNMSYFDGVGTALQYLSILQPGPRAKSIAPPPPCYMLNWQVIYSQFGLAIHPNDHQARRRFVEWAQNEIAVVPDFHKRILFSDEAHFWLNGYVNKQNCRIWNEANPQVYVETPLHPEKLTVWCALWAGGILLQKR